MTQNNQEKQQQQNNQRFVTKFKTSTVLFIHLVFHTT